MTDPSPPPPPAPVQPRTSTAAILALITGILFVPLLPIILGIVALNEVKKSGGRVTGGGMGIAGIVLGFLGIFSLLAVLAPAILRAHKSADLTEATNNARNLGIFMYAFEDEWGTFPSEQILRENPDRFAGVRPGESSNTLLSMLIAGGYTSSENIFFAKGGAGTNRKPDNVTTPSARLLEPGECGFGYVMLQGRAQRTTDNGGRPLLVAPLSLGQDSTVPRFSENPYNGRMVCLRIDQALKQYRIERSGHARLYDGTFLFETGPDTVWESDVPDVRMPE